MHPIGEREGGGTPGTRGVNSQRYRLDVGVAEVVDQVGEELNELTPKRRFLLV